MDFKSFLAWKRRDNPQKVINEHLEDLAQLAKFPGFRVYLDIIEWRIHNLGERSGLRPKEAPKNAQIIEGLRIVLQDFKKIQEQYKKRLESEKK